MRRNRAARDARERTAADELAARLQAQPLQLRARAGDGGRLFGSVTGSDVADAVLAQTGVELDRRKVVLAEAIKELGTTTASVRLHSEVTAEITIEVVAE